jgi:hypothetical protein
MIYLLYVDDIVLTVSSMSLLRRKILVLFIIFLVCMFNILLLAFFFLSAGIMIEILERAGMSDCKPCTTPININPKLSVDGDPISDPTEFCSLARALQ